MLEIIKYLPICIILVSSSNIKALKLNEDCDYGDCGQTGYFASGSAYSSQFLLPDGTVVTNSKGSSISSDGVQRTFHELKQEADKYVSNNGPNTNYISRNEYTDKLPILKVSQIQGMTNLPYISHSSQSESRGSAQFNSQQQYTEEQKQSSNTNVNANPYLYQQIQTSIPDRYQSNLQPESKNAKLSGSVNPVLNSNQQAFAYYPLPLDEQELSNSNVDDNKLTPLPADGSVSASSFQQKIKSYSQHLNDANANIPGYLFGPKANAFTINGINPAYKNDEVYRFLPNLIPQVTKGDFKEKHYPGESYLKQEQPEKKIGNHYVAPVEPKTPYHVKLPADEMRRSKLEEQSSQYVGGQDRTSKITVRAPSSDGRRSRLVIKVQAPSEAVGSSQSFRQETHSQSVKSNVQPILPEMNPAAHVQGVLESASSDLPQNDAAAEPQQNDYVYVPISLVSNNQVKNSNTNGYGTESSSFHLNIPILLRGVPQNVRISNPKSDSSAKLSQSLNLDKVSYDSASNSLSVPDNGYVGPQNVDKHSSSSSNVHYFSTNGNVGELLVPNSDIYVPADADLLQNPSFVRKFSNSNANLNSERCPTCIHSSSASLDTSQKKSYGISTIFSSHSSDVNGKKIDNREASVTVNDNGKIDSYHVKS